MATKVNGRIQYLLVIFGAVGVLVGTITTSIVTIIQASRTAEKLDAVHNETKQTNVAMNAIYRVSLMTQLSDKMRLYEMTKLPLDKQAVDDARKAVADHDEQQRRVDIERKLQGK